MARIDLVLPTPYLNAAGSAGFSPPARWPLPDPQGVFITNPVSRSARTPAASRACLAYPGGYLLHSGLPNPGLPAVLRKHALHWQRAPLPVWVHLIPSTPLDAAWMVRQLEGRENITAIELGLEIAEDPAPAVDILSAAASELPIVAALPLNDVSAPLLERLANAGAAALTLAAPRGVLPSPSGLVSGRLFGPALFPLALAALREARRHNLPVIVAAGVWSRTAADALLAAGAAAVAVDGILWRGGLGW